MGCADNDPIVGAHARALLHGHPAGRTASLQADLRERAAVARLVGGLVLAEPGLVPVAAWRPDHPVALLRTPEVLAWAGAGRKP